MAKGGTFGTHVTIDPVKLAEFMRSSQGPVIRHMIEQGERVKIKAQELVGVYEPPDAYSAANRKRRPGTLRDSIVKRVADVNGQPAVIVGSDDPIALWHHEGTQPHVVVPRTKPRLVFYWPKAGAVVSFLRVNHPGTRPNRFLTKALDVLRGG